MLKKSCSICVFVLVGAGLLGPGSVSATRSDPLLIQAAGAALNVDGSISGAWYDPAFDGAGFLIEVLTDGRATVYWFTFDDEGNQQWLLGFGTIDGSQIVIDELLRTSGGVFGDAFDTADVVTTTVGQAVFDFSDCNTALVDFTVDGVSSSQTLQRLTTINRQVCGKTAQSKQFREQLHRTGSWFNIGRSGEGFVVQILADQQVLVIWFTYDKDGNQAWFIGLGQISAEYLTVQQMDFTVGGRFGPEHDPSAVQRTSWGSIELALGCEAGTASYDAIDPGFGSNQYPLSRLTRIEGSLCVQDQYRPAALDELVGRWQSDGFGLAVRVTDSNLSIYEQTSEHCLQTLAGPTVAFEMGLDIVINDENDRIQVKGLDSVTAVEFDKINQLPELCQNGGTGANNDPQHNFDVLWNTFDELYATFEIRGVDWDQQGATFRPMVTPSTTDDELFTILANMIDPLDDGHVTLTSPTRYINTGSNPAGTELFLRAHQAVVDQIIVNQYLDGQARSAALGAIRYGLIGSVGYLEVNSLNNFYPGQDSAQRLTAFRQDLDLIFDLFASENVDSVILDLRRNDGGDSRFGLELVGRFARGRERLAFSATLPNERGMTQPFPVAVAPTPGTGFDGPVVTLISPLSASAAEITTFGMRAFPHVTLIGDHTFGVLSRTERTLPNGWIVSITVSLIAAPDGALYEAVGIPADIVVETFPESDLNNNIDSGIDAALAALADQN